MDTVNEGAELIALYLIGVCLYPLECVLQLLIHVKQVTSPLNL